jgi:hypothetical protein
MKMVGNQAKTVDQHSIPFADFPQAFQHLVVIVFITEYLLPAIAPVDAMEKCSWITDSAASAHRPPPNLARFLPVCLFYKSTSNWKIFNFSGQAPKLF